MPLHLSEPVGIDPRVDVVFQKLFGDPQHERVLLQFLNDVLAPPVPITRAEVRNPFHPGMFADHKSVIVDVEARDETGRTFQVEMQRLSDRGLEQRMLYGWARLYVEQLSRGASYASLLPVVSIWLCEADAFPDEPDAHLRYGVMNVRRQTPRMPDFRLEVLQLSRWTRDRSALASETSMPWFWFMNEAQSWREVPASIDNEALEEAMEILNEFRTDVALNDLYRARLEAERVEKGRQEELEDARAELEAARALAEQERAAKEAERAAKEAALAELAALRAALGRDPKG